MSPEEKKKFTDIIKAMDDDEKRVAVKLFPSDLLWDEIKRREQLERETVRRVKEALKVEEEK